MTNAPPLPDGLKDRLIGYANCNRCELTPFDARYLIVALAQLSEARMENERWKGLYLSAIGADAQGGSDAKQI